MSNSKHTPGPWFVTESEGDADVMRGCSIGIDDEFGQRGGRDYHLVTVVHGDPDELAANAALVAASPDLLAALIKCHDLLVRNNGEGAYSDAIWEARAAMAKATGN